MSVLWYGRDFYLACSRGYGMVIVVAGYVCGSDNFIGLLGWVGFQVCFVWVMLGCMGMYYISSYWGCISMPWRGGYISSK